MQTREALDAQQLAEVNLLDVINYSLAELTIEKWNDGGEFEEMRDKDYVAQSILSDITPFLKQLPELTLSPLTKPQMPKATKADITFCANVSEKIQAHLSTQGYEYDKETMSTMLKGYATIQSGVFDEPREFNKSKVDYTHEEMQVFKDMIKLFAEEVGYEFDERDNIDLNFYR